MLACLTGIVPTKFAATLVESEELRTAQEQSTWLGRLGTVEDMAAGDHKLMLEHFLICSFEFFRNHYLTSVVWDFSQQFFAPCLSAYEQ